jgi:hypothetical protein
MALPGDGTQHGNHQLPGRAPGVDRLATHAEHDQADATASEIVHNPQKARGASLADPPPISSASDAVRDQFRCHERRLTSVPAADRMMEAHLI